MLTPQTLRLANIAQIFYAVDTLSIRFPIINFANTVVEGVAHDEGGDEPLNTTVDKDETNVEVVVGNALTYIPLINITRSSCPLCILTLNLSLFLASSLI